MDNLLSLAVLSKHDTLISSKPSRLNLSKLYFYRYITTGATKPPQPKRGNSQQGRRRRLLTATKVSTPKCGRRGEGQLGVTLPAVEDKQQQGVANSCPDINRLTRDIEGLEIIEELPLTASTDSLVKSQQVHFHHCPIYRAT